MKAGYFVATAFVGVAMFWVGLQVRPLLDSWEQQEEAEVPEDEKVEAQQTEQSAAELAAQGYLSVEELKIRIDDGDVQWFDGMMWHTVASTEELAKEDKFYVAQEDFLKFEEQMKQQREERKAQQENPEEQGETLLVGQKEAPKPVSNPSPNRPAATAPAASPDGGGSDDGNSGSSSGSDNHDSGNSGGGSSGGSGGEVNSGGDGGNTGNGGSAGDSGNTGSGDSGGDTGDGENMEWSDDYL